MNKKMASTVAGAVAAAGTVTGVAFAVNAAQQEPEPPGVTLIGPASADTTDTATETATATESVTTGAATAEATTPASTVVPLPVQTTAAPAKTTAPAKKARTVTGMTTEENSTPAGKMTGDEAPPVEPEPEVVYESVPPTVAPPVIPPPAPGSPEGENLMPGDG